LPDKNADADPLNRISFVSSGVSIAEAQDPNQDPNRPKRVLGFRDLVLFYVVTGISLRWIATAAAAGPSSIVIWIGAWLCFYTPLALSVLELSSRYPSEGGLYVWSKRAFGDFSGFMSAWTYWTSNLPYFPAVLYFAASNILFMRQNAWVHLSNNATFYIIFSLLTLSAATLMNIVGLDVGKWLHNVGALAMWIPVGIVIVMGLIAWHRYGSATSFTVHSMTPSMHFNDLIFWSVLTFAFGGCETASFMGEEIKNPRRSIPFALLFGGVTVAFCYIVGTAAILLALPSSEVSSLQGLVQAISKTASRGFPRSLACRSISDRAQQHRRCRCLSRRGSPPALCSRHRPLPAAGIWRTPSPLENSMGCPADSVLSRRSLHFSRSGRNQRQGRLRRAGQHGRNHVFHPVPVPVRGHDQTAARPRWPGCDPRAGRKDGGEAGGGSRICNNDVNDFSVSDSAARRTQQTLGSVEDCGRNRSSVADRSVDVLGGKTPDGAECAVALAGKLGVQWSAVLGL
jgi:hypothetical protein